MTVARADECLNFPSERNVRATCVKASQNRKQFQESSKPASKAQQLDLALQEQPHSIGHSSVSAAKKASRAAPRKAQ
jgi:hypothetical protein